MTFEQNLIKALNKIGDGLHAVAKAIDNVPDNAKEIDDAGTAVERGLSDVAEAINNLEMNR